jgi:hypothetical protein
MVGRGVGGGNVDVGTAVEGTEVGGGTVGIGVSDGETIL